MSCAIHGYVPVDDLDRALIDTPIVQRLRYIRQNDVAYLVFPAMNTSRFEHSLGVMHIAGQLPEFALSNSHPGQKDEYCRALGELLEKVAAKPVGTLEDSFRALAVAAAPPSPRTSRPSRTLSTPKR